MSTRLLARLILIGLLFFLSTARADDPEENLLKQGIQLFQQKQWSAARGVFDRARQNYPNNPLSYYFLGELHFQQDHLKEAMESWRQYTQLDPEGARGHNIPARLTRLEEEQRRQELKALLANEEKISKEPPTPNTIAVFPLTNRGDARFDVLAKGVTAFIITDLAKVPGLKVLERAQIQKLLDEIKLVKSGLTGDEGFRTGRLLKAEKVINGDFSIQ